MPVLRVHRNASGGALLPVTVRLTPTTTDPSAKLLRRSIKLNASRNNGARNYKSPNIEIRFGRKLPIRIKH